MLNFVRRQNDSKDRVFLTRLVKNERALLRCKRSLILSREVEIERDLPSMCLTERISTLK